MTKKHEHFYQVEEGWIEVWPGKQFHFSQLAPSEVDIESVAHSLSQLCRYNGHTRRFYSVAEHACIMSDWVLQQPWANARDALTALHHDDAEFIIGDMARPVKVTIPAFKALETEIDEVIALRFGTIYPFPAWLKEIDTRIIRDERPVVMVPSSLDWGTDKLEPLGVKFWNITGRFPRLVKRQFILRHKRLMSQWRAESGLG